MASFICQRERALVSAQVYYLHAPDDSNYHNADHDTTMNPQLLPTKIFTAETNRVLGRCSVAECA